MYVENNLSGYGWSDFEAFQWIEKLNGPAGTATYLPGLTDIWYLPSVDELGNNDEKSLYTVFENYGKTAFNSLLTAAGGIELDDSVYPYYWSSTEVDDRSAWVVLFSNGNTNSDGKVYRSRVRAILAF